jgi:Zn-dependent protease
MERDEQARPGHPSQAMPEEGKRSGPVAFLVFILLFIATKVGPLLGTMTTMYLSVLAYSLFFGWKLAAAFLVGVLIHELGHGVAAKLVGLPVSAPIFIPFIGAFIMMKDKPKTTWQESVVGIGGPAAGILAGIGMLLIGMSLRGTVNGDMLLVAAWLTFKINMFNLIPVMGLDGDRISQPFRAWYWLPILLGVAGVIYAFSSIIPVEPISLMIIGMVMIFGCVKCTRTWSAESGAKPKRLVDRLQQKEYVQESTVLPWQRHAAAIGYFLIFALLCIFAIYSNTLRPAIITPQ